MNTSSLFAARQRGEKFWEDQNSISAEGLLSLGVDVSLPKYRMLVRTPKGTFPQWQFRYKNYPDEYTVIPGVREVITVLRVKGQTDAGCARFFLSHNIRLGGAPIDYLGKGRDPCVVLECAMVFDEHGAQ